MAMETSCGMSEADHCTFVLAGMRTSCWLECVPRVGWNAGRAPPKWLVGWRGGRRRRDFRYKNNCNLDPLTRALINKSDPVTERPRGV